jgi:hypothetical protein
MNHAKTSANPLGLQSESIAAVASICWDDWFQFDEQQQKCVFRSTSRLDQAEVVVSVLLNAKEGQA